MAREKEIAELMGEALRRGLPVRPSQDRFRQMACNVATVEVYSPCLSRYVEVMYDYEYPERNSFSLPRQFDSAAKLLMG